MQNRRPEKILSKKFVRGKPYYKFKWEGAGKEHSTWQTPASLRQFKSMINKYEIKNWGCPLDDKFFDPSLYETKSMTPRRKVVDKKSQKVAKKTEKTEKKKIEEASSSSSDNASSSSTQQEDQIAGRETQRATIERPLPEPQSNDRALPKQIKNTAEQLQIIDLDDEELAKPKDKQSETQEKQENKALASKELINKKTSQINIDDLDRKQKQTPQQGQQTEFRRDLGLSLPTEQPLNPQPTKPSKSLSLSKALNLEIEPLKQICRIAHIYHLEKVTMGNHLYLVEFKDKQMRKMTTQDLMDRYPEELVGFLEEKYRAKCSRRAN